MPKKSVVEQARDVANELESGEFPDDLEPQYVAWLLLELVKLISEKPL